MRVLRGRSGPVAEHETDPRYQDALARLAERGRFGIRLGLGRTRALLHRLGDPHLGLPGVLIGGTNGKGSTQALVAAALREGGYLVGQTPKPHLVSYRERIVVDGRPISVEAFVELLEEVLPHADAVARRHGPPTEFEVLTCAAFTWFARCRVQVGVIEVGLGGRLDATNAWQGGVSAITNVELDHMEYLGTTLEAIAREKAAIVKRGDARALSGAAPPALEVIRRRAARVAVPFSIVEPLPVLSVGLKGTAVRAPDGEPLVVGLLGRHQAANAAMAWAILDALDDAGIATVAAAQRRAALSSARWPGRMELIHGAGQPTVLLDGAHNPHGFAALATALAELLPQLGGGPPTLLMGMLANHWQDGMLDPLKGALPSARVTATTVPGAPTSMTAEQLAAAWGSGATAVADTDEAFNGALEQAARAGGPLIVCGSLYLVGYVRARLIGADQS